jgi:DNA-binding NarL/FixJ family response regulator
MIDEESISPVRVLIADDNKALRDAVTRLLTAVPEVEVCGEADNGRDALNMSIGLKPDVVLMDIAMPEMNGLEVTRQLRRVTPTVEVLVFTQHDSTHAMQAALDAGARGYLAKTQAGSLLEAIRTVSRHQRYSSLHRLVSASATAQ